MLSLAVWLGASEGAAWESFWGLLRATRSSGRLWEPLGSPGAPLTSGSLWEALGAPGALELWEPLGVSGSFGGVRASGSARGRLGASRSLWASGSLRPLEPLEASGRRGHLGAPGVASGSLWSLREPVGAVGSLWEPLGTDSGSPWEPL